MAGVLELRGRDQAILADSRAVRNISFSLNDHEILFVIGPNGAGKKTTVFNLISGFFHPDEGAIVFSGNDISRLAPHQTSRHWNWADFSDREAAGEP